MKRILVVGLLVVFALCALTAAQAKSVKLEYKFTKGAVDKYKMIMDMKMSMPGMPEGAGGFSGKVSMLMTQKVVDVYSDGSAKIEATMSNMKVDFPGMPADAQSQIPEKATMTMTISKLGKVLKMEGMQNLPGSMGMPGMDFSRMASQFGVQGLMFPDRQVEINETWTDAIPMPMGGGEMKVQSTLMNAALPIGSEVASKIGQTYSGYIDMAALMQATAGSVEMDPQAKAAMSQVTGGMNIGGTSEIYFSPELGKMIKTDAHITMDANFCLPGMMAEEGGASAITMHMDMNMNISRAQ